MAILADQVDEPAEKIANIRNGVHKLVVIHHQGEMLIDLAVNLVDKCRQHAFHVLLKTDQTPQNGF